MRSFRRTFNPTVEEQIEDLEKLSKLFSESYDKKCCYTCIHYEYHEVPGYVTDFGDCKKNKNWFERYMSDNPKECKYYARSNGLDKLNEEIKRLKEGI